MKIKKTSWHYRMADWLWNDVPWYLTSLSYTPAPKSLCGYFWWVVISPIIAIFLSIFSLFLILLMVLSVAFAITAYAAILVGAIPWAIHLWTTNTYILSFPANQVSSVIVMLIWFFVCYSTAVIGKSGGKGMEGSALDLSIKYVKAKKQGVCPLIEYV